MMGTVTGAFESGEAARNAVGKLREAGFGAEDITFVLERAGKACPTDGIEQAADAGHRFGALASDVGETAASFVPFIGRGIAQSPLAHALRRATEDAGESAGRIIAAATEGGLLSAPDFSGSDGRVASVVVRASDGQAGKAAAVLTAAGAVETEVENGA